MIKKAPRRPYGLRWRRFRLETHLRRPRIKIAVHGVPHAKRDFSFRAVNHS